MIQITRILCPIDFSEFSRHALHHAIALARQYKSELTVMHVVVNQPDLDLPPVALSESERDCLGIDMRRFVEPTPPGLPMRMIVREAADIRGEIIGQARALPADLLVIGSHGRSGFERLVLGSVTEKVMRMAPCPVLVVPCRASDIDAGGPAQSRRTRILCAVDFSMGSLRALEYALSLAEEADAELAVLHVIEVPPELREHMPISRDIDIARVRAAAEARCLQRLRELIPASVKNYYSVKTIVHEGAAYRHILEFAAERNTDMIVMGGQGRGALDRLVFGSNTARVARAATCPVLIVGRH